MRIISLLVYSAVIQFVSVVKISLRNAHIAGIILLSNLYCYLSRVSIVRPSQINYQILIHSKRIHKVGKVKRCTPQKNIFTKRRDKGSSVFKLEESPISNKDTVVGGSMEYLASPTDLSVSSECSNDMHVIDSALSIYTTDLNSGLRTENTIIAETNYQLQKEKRELMQENQMLKEENDFFKMQNELLQTEVMELTGLYLSTQRRSVENEKSILKELHTSVQLIRSLFAHIEF
jgi:hypothetical protein